LSDAIILVGMAVAIALGGYGIKRVSGIFFKAGSAFSAFTACVGLAYFGYAPFFGGTDHDVSTFFGSILLILGVLSWLLFMAVDNALSGDKGQESEITRE
jgi:hypothetical protein